MSVTSPDGAVATAAVDSTTGRIDVGSRAATPLDEVVLRSYCIGAAHMALGWVTSEGLAVDAEGDVHDLTVRSFGVLRASDTPAVDVEIDADGGRPTGQRQSDAVFAAVAAAVWLADGCPPVWPDWPPSER